MAELAAMSSGDEPTLRPTDSSEGKQDRVVITGLPDAGLDGEWVLLLV